MKKRFVHMESVFPKEFLTLCILSHVIFSSFIKPKSQILNSVML